MLRKVFTSFASFAVRVAVEDLDGAKFSKLCRDAKLLSKSFGSIDVDIVFAQVKVGICDQTRCQYRLLNTKPIALPLCICLCCCT